MILRFHTLEQSSKALPTLNTDSKTTIMSIPFAGNPIDWVDGDDVSPDSVLSHAKGAFLPFFTTKDAIVLRQLCREFKDAVTEHKWRDEETKINSQQRVQLYFVRSAESSRRL